MVKKRLEEPLEEGEFIEEEEIDTIERPPEPKPKQKRVLTEKQKEAIKLNLAKGREALKKKQEDQRDFSKKKAEELVIKKANLILKQKASKETKIKNMLGIDNNDDDDETEVEERIMKKPKKKRIIYREESDTEQEVIIKRRPRKAVVEEEAEPKKEPKPAVLPPLKQYLKFV